MARHKLRFTKRRRSGRAFALFIILFLLALVLAPPTKQYFIQRAQISALKAQLVSDNRTLDAARKELLLWQDPQYIKSQARERLHFVLPGERQYIVTERQNANNAAAKTKIATAFTNGQPWYLHLIASISESGVK